jgi:hypothetical protein
MKHLIVTLLLAFCATGYGQTIKSLGYNATNGQVVYTNTNTLTFTNQVFFGNIELADGSSIDVDGGIELNGNFVFSSGISFNNTNALADTRSTLGLRRIVTTDQGQSGWITTIYEDTNASVPIIEVGGQATVTVFRSIFFWPTNNAAGGTRTNLGLPLPALTNTSNVTMMRALAGSTNTNEPFSGSVSVVGTNNTNTLVFTNGILREVTTP